MFSGAARRRLLGVAVLDGLLAWLPHRHDVGPVRHIGARRLDDLAYGAGLWAGAVCARSAAALLPTRPPRS